MIRLVVFEEFKIIGGVNHRDLWVEARLLTEIAFGVFLHQSRLLKMSLTL